MSQTRSGYQQSVGGLVGALLAALALIGAIWLLSRLSAEDPGDPARTVDYTAELAQARRQAPFDVLAPEPAPRGWRATSVEWSGAGPENSWHLGFLTGDGEYVGLEQGNAIPGDFVEASTPADQPGEPVSVDGETWVTLASEDGDETALVYEADKSTTVVTGTAPRDELVAFAESLSPR